MRLASVAKSEYSEYIGKNFPRLHKSEAVMLLTPVGLRIDHKSFLAILTDPERKALEVKTSSEFDGIDEVREFTHCNFGLLPSECEAFLRLVRPSRKKSRPAFLTPPPILRGGLEVSPDWTPDF